VRSLCLLSIVLVLVACGPEAETQPAPPNIVIVIADDQGWGDLSIHGNENLSTPNIDSLARDGAVFDRFFVAPVCSPTRAELLTGRYHARGGVYSTSAGGERLDLDERTLADTLLAGGYRTGAFGKWHNGSQHPYHPNARGFEEFYGFTSGHWAQYFDPVLEHNSEWVRGEGFIIDDLTRQAMEFMAEADDRPFFAYIPYNTPHSPMQVPDRFWERFADKELEQQHRESEREDLAHTRAALAMVENIDWNVGRLLQKLDELSIAENTIVLYLSDNGPNGYRWNDRMKGRKGSTDEGGVRVPALMRWPARIQPGTEIDRIAAAIDLLPTFAELAGVEVVGDRPLDGRSLAPLLLGSKDEWPDREIVSAWRDRLSVRNQRFRLDTAGALFDMVDDPEQRIDVSAEHPEIARRLGEIAQQAGDEFAAELGEDDRPIPVGYAPATWLPARDAVASGGVDRSNRYPNSSYFLNWTSTESAVTWDVEVAEPGAFAVTLYYALAEGDEGVELELGFSGQTLNASLEEAHDVPLIGADDDRVPRQESYTKDFRPTELGALEMGAGRSPLTLRATRIPGDEALEVHSLVLTRIER